MQLKEIMGFQTSHSHSTKWIPQPIFKAKEVPIDVYENSLIQRTTPNLIDHSQTNSSYILSGYDSWMVSTNSVKHKITLVASLFFITMIKVTFLYLKYENYFLKNLFSCFLTTHHLHRNMIQEILRTNKTKKHMHVHYSTKVYENVCVY